MAKSFDIAKLEIQKVGEFEDDWKMAKAPVHGTVLVFEVIDRNLAKDNSWVFYAQVPDKTSEDDNVIVRPEAAPSRDELGDVERRAVTFLPASEGVSRGQWYCKLNLADPTGERTKIGVRFGERDALPAWFAPLRQKMKKKQAVKATKGTDGESLVMLVKSGDYPSMIQIFFASRVWPLLTKFVLERE
jgi:hypothetical protein